MRKETGDITVMELTALIAVAMNPDAEIEKVFGEVKAVRRHGFEALNELLRRLSNAEDRANPRPVLRSMFEESE